MLGLEPLEEGGQRSHADNRLEDAGMHERKAIETIVCLCLRQHQLVAEAIGCRH